ncbi:MAG TPA: chloride channel protein, partial [Gemmatimonadales bacterium]|nr:chloride channel protein [Gemmatimonadales bacterium]
AALASLAPGLSISPAAYGVVGMGAMVAAATGAPITGILMVFEMTDDSALMIPLMISTALAVVVARRIEPHDLYRGWLVRRGIHLEHGVDRDVLDGLVVGDALSRDAEVVSADEPVDRLRTRLAFADQTVYPVVDEGRRLIGLITHRELAQAARQADDEQITARALARPTEAVALDTSLGTVARRLGTLGLAALPVVDPDSGRVLGTIGRSAILARYGRAIELG